MFEQIFENIERQQQGVLINIQKIEIEKLNLKILFGDGSWSTLKLLYRPKCSLKAKPEHSQTKLKRSHSVQSAPENYCLFPKK